MSTKSNRDIRARASDLFRFNFGRVVMLTLAASSAPALLSGISGAPTLLSELSTLTGEASRYGQNLMNYQSTLQTAFPLMLLVSLLTFLLSAVLHVGYTRGLLLLDAGERVQGNVLLSRWKHGLGCIGLQVWVVLKAVAWAMPGILLSALGEAMSAGGAKTFGTLISFAGSILSAALVIPASLRYSLAIHVFAENPEIGVYDAVERSKHLMAYRKWQLFCLTLPWGWQSSAPGCSPC